MSRCFPFPPPGYEKKFRSNEYGDLVAKEKHKEKKHKKGKDEEKRDIKLRKDKDRDRSKEKHKEKKDRNEKHKDKKKEKDKSRTSEDQRHGNLTEVSRNSVYDNQKSEELKDSRFTEELGRRIRDQEQGVTNRLPDVVSAISQRRASEGLQSSLALFKESISTVMLVTSSVQRRVQGALAIQKQTDASKDIVSNFNSTEPERNESLNASSVHKRIQTGGIPAALEKERVASCHKIEDANSIGQRRNHVTGKLMDNSARLVERGVDKLLHANLGQKERTAYTNLSLDAIDASVKRNDETVVTRKNEGIGVVSRENQKIPLQNTTYTVERTCVIGQIDKYTNRKTEEKERTEEEKAKGAKREGFKDRDHKEKKRKEKDKDRRIEKEREREKKKVKVEVKHVEYDELRERGSEKNNQILMGGLDSRPLAPHQTQMNPTVTVGNCKKRKEWEINGFVHEPQPDWHPNKIPETDTSTSNAVENGKALDGNSISSPVSSIIFEVINDTRSKERKDNSAQRHVNGNTKVHLGPLISVDLSKSSQLYSQLHEDHPSSLSLRTPVVDLSKSCQASSRPTPSVSIRPSVAVDSSKTSRVVSQLLHLDLFNSSQVTLQLPHPDSMYLNTIYSVPALEEQVGSDEQDWLFSSKKCRLRIKREVDASPPHVWAQGNHLEAADVIALPYVVPF